MPGLKRRYRDREAPFKATLGSKKGTIKIRKKGVLNMLKSPHPGRGKSITDVVSNIDAVKKPGGGDDAPFTVEVEHQDLPATIETGRDFGVRLTYNRKMASAEADQIALVVQLNASAFPTPKSAAPWPA